MFVLGVGGVFWYIRAEDNDYAVVKRDTADIKNSIKEFKDLVLTKQVNQQTAVQTALDSVGGLAEKVGDLATAAKGARDDIDIIKQRIHDVEIALKAKPALTEPLDVRIISMPKKNIPAATGTHRPLIPTNSLLEKVGIKPHAEGSGAPPKVGP
jgi:hypothetical protein